MAMKVRSSLNKSQTPKSYGYLKVLIFIGIGFILLMVLIPLIMNQRGKVNVKKLSAAEEKMRVTKEIPRQSDGAPAFQGNSAPDQNQDNLIPKDQKTPPYPSPFEGDKAATQPETAGNRLTSARQPEQSGPKEALHGTLQYPSSLPNDRGDNPRDRSSLSSAPFSPAPAPRLFANSTPSSSPGTVSHADNPALSHENSKLGLKSPTNVVQKKKANGDQPGTLASVSPDVKTGGPHSPQTQPVAGGEKHPGAGKTPPTIGTTSKPTPGPTAGTTTGEPAATLATSAAGSTTEPIAPLGAGQHRYVIQVGAYVSAENAEDTRAIFQKKGYATVIKSRHDPKMGQMYLVQLAPMDDVKKAKEVMDRIRKEVGMKTMMLKVAQ